MGSGVDQNVQISCWFITIFVSILLFVVVLSSGQQSCDKTRKIFKQSWGEISDSDGSTNYTKDSHCEWLIRAENASQFISLTFRSLFTECAYDYIFVYDGDSYQSRLLGSYSGRTEPQRIVASSGSMLILLYSDTNYVLDGFKAEFSVTNCPNNCSDHGKCVNHKCVCNGDWIGSDCSKDACPNNCNSHLGQGKCLKDHCECAPGYSGQSCSLKDENPAGNEYHWLSDSLDGFYPRAAHTAVYVDKTDSLYVFGGYDLNQVIGSLQIYRFKKSLWENEFGIEIRNSHYGGKLDSALLRAVLYQDDNSAWGLSHDRSLFKSILLSVSENEHSLRRTRSNTFQNTTEKDKIDEIIKQSRPGPRYGHAASQVEDGFVIYGGKLDNGKLTNELWFYNVTENKGMEWSLRATSSKFMPPSLTRHTITLAGDYLYVFGGATSTGAFSSSIFKIKLSNNPEEEQWEEVKCKGGKSLDVRVVAHTTVYYAPINSLIVYAGITTGNGARFSKLSDRMFAFNLDTKYWTEILYPRAYLPDSYVPRERAFHTSIISGNYLIVFGGYSHRHNKEEICYDNQIYLYHLGCQIWVHHDVLGHSKNASRYPKQQGVFAHAAALRQNTLLLVGGYHGNVNGDLLAYTLPPMIHESEDPESKCQNYQQNECLSNPDCGWCSADTLCYGRTIGANCTTNLQTGRCPGICRALGDCHSCLIFGKSYEAKGHNSVARKLGLDKCSWCVQNARCHHKDDYGICGEDTPSQDVGWWGKTGIEITSPEYCSNLDKRPGLTLIRYLYPVDFNMPDAISVINATMVDFNLPVIASQTEQTFHGEIVTRLIGFIHPPDNWKDVGEKLMVCASHSQAELRIGQWGQDVKLAGNFTADQTTCTQADWPSLEPGKIFIDLQAKRSLSNVNQHNSKIGLQHNRTNDGAKAFTFEYLEPFSNESCNSYTNCLQCLSDSSCGYCELTETCVSRQLNETQSCSNGVEWNYLTLHPTKCKNCSNFISCEDCVNTTSNCEWWVEDARCARKGRSPKAVKSLQACPMPCHLRNECSTCLNGPGRCVWCKATETCFSFSIYTSEFQFGSCREWLDLATPVVSSHTENWQVEVSDVVPKCRSCSSNTNCSSCLKTLNCGWCFDRDNPIEGVCIHGDFNSSAVDCSTILNKTDVEFSYATCPDVDECGLGLHDCHQEAKCTNTHGSYTCQCRKGFIGDGKKNCTKTCFENCVHGTCSGPPHYKCNCDLGWTGDDCSINCGCNNHSTCETEVGKCDFCQDYTEGTYCERCQAGSYGSAVDQKGCKKCNCNEHGNETLGICDSNTGECFCKDNTEGLYCEVCNKDYYGDPKDGGQCYFQCEPRGVLRGGKNQGLGSFQSYRPPWGGPETRECLWIISSKSSIDATSDSVIRLEIDAFESNVSCSRNAIYIYDGLPDLTGVAQQKQLLGVYCSEDQFPKYIEAKSGHMTIFYKQSVFGQGFNAIYSVESCKLDTCTSPYICDGDRCTCPEKLLGPKCDSQLCPNNCNADLGQGTCDSNYGRCICNPGFGNKDCSREIRNFNLVFTELFNSQFLTDTLDHLRKTIPRFGHSLVCDRRGSLWMFGGYSLSHGALNDIRQFDTKNSTWLQVTVEGITMPVGRYYHSAEIISGKQAIYVYGGMSDSRKNNTDAVLDDFWRFSLQSQKWELIELKSELKPGALAGHTLTLIKDLDKEYLLLIGGLSFENGLNNDIWLFNISDSAWQKLDSTGAVPNGIFGHSTVYHSPSQAVYVYGGYIYEGNKTVISNKLFSLKIPSYIWNELPTFDELNRPNDLLPRARFGHAAVATDNYMVVYGGRTSPHNASDILIAYNFNCNQWVRLTEDVDFVGDLPIITYGHAMALDVDSGFIYIVGGWDGSSTGRVVKISIPADLCALWSRSKYLCRHYMGCSFCAVKPFEEFRSHCYSGFSHSCDDRNGTLILNSGQTCDLDWISRRNCSSFTSCTTCLAAWPSHPDLNQTCVWFEEQNKCAPVSINCTESENCTSQIKQVQKCPSSQCMANDCTSCNEIEGCVWTFNGQVHQCMNGSAVENKKVDVIKACPVQCSSHKNCSSCLRALSSEGGWDECFWSTQLGLCISPSYQPLLCSGGICGLVLTPDEKDYCPEPCESFDQCQSCLRHAHCGFCSKEGTEGEGVCTEGSMTEHPARSTCDILYSNAKNYTLKDDDRFSWNYVKCAPENECINGHHNCDPKSEECHDLNFGYECRCATGYKSESGKCIPQCENGCVRGVCKEPNKCMCDFGYVGENCSIQCQCNGHANCEGPDKLDTCGECHNNTMGSQCEKCAKWYVKDEKTAECVPCREFCSGHTDICVPADMKELVKNLSKTEIDIFLTEGVTGEAICLGCQNFTDGERCDTCLTGYFRGTPLATDPCRECECHGHGSICDPITGEKCDCKNNTESDPTCTAKSMKNSVYPCWNVQCSKCKESYAGHPIDGHQCYKQITVESKMCFDAHSIDECKVKPKALHPGQTVFFVIQPRFMNVDIRIIVDVTQGELDFFMSPQDDSFVVEANRSTGFHEIYLDHNYKWGTQSAEFDLLQPISLSPEKNKYRNLTEDDKSFLSPPPDCKTKTDGFFVKDYFAKELCTYITLTQCNTLLRVFGLKNRLVITLPQTSHNLSGTRFFAALRATGTQGASYGLIFFRQDQLHIDLFVFFSVFFSCFFLFLAICVVAWKFKQAADIRRARRRHNIELIHMAQRPFACIDLLIGSDAHTPSHRRHKNKSRQSAQYVAQEITADNAAAVATVFIRLPGRQKAPINLAMGSTLISLSNRKKRHTQPPAAPQPQNN